jgi:glucokinase
MPSLAIGIDLGCTNIKGLLVNDTGQILAETSAETNEQDDTHWKNAVAIMIDNLKNQSKANVDTIGLCAPGLADAGNEYIAHMPARLPGIECFSWSHYIGETVHVINDAHAALMAETTFGAARQLRHAVLLSLGTGVGGGLLIEGKLYQGLLQRAGHLGHMTVDAGAPDRDITNMPGSIEDAIGNATLEKRSLGRYTTTDALVNDFRKGDSFATWVWLSSVRRLAICIASVVNIVSPEAIILSGGIIKADDALLRPLQDFLELYEWRPGGTKTPVRLAQFTDRAGALGATGFAISRLKTSMA